MHEKRKMRNNNTLLILVVFIITTVMSVHADIPIIRQITSTIFLTFLPGWLILHLLKLNSLSQTSKFVLSVGLSIAFVMFAGLIINTIYPLLGYDGPLSMPSIIATFSVLLLIMTFVAWLRNGNDFTLRLENLKLNVKEKAYLLLPALFPLISIIGMRVMNTTDNNVLLLALLAVITAYIIFLVIRRHDVTERVYPLIILCISVSLVLLLGLRSNNIIGTDVHAEYYFFQLTQNQMRWQIFEQGNPLSACLSITLLPAIYKALLNFDSVMLMKILYPLIFAVSPLIIFTISRKYMNGLYAFLAAILLFTTTVYFDSAANPRTTLAILFFGLAVMVIYHEQISDYNKKLLFIIFAFACTVSHYATTYIFLLVFILTWLLTIIIRRLQRREKETVAPSKNNSLLPSSKTNRHAADYDEKSLKPSTIKTHIAFTTLMLFFAMLFFWYGQLSSAAFTSGVEFISETLLSLNQFFVTEIRDNSVTSLFSNPETFGGVPQRVEWALSWLLILLIGIGVLILLLHITTRFKKSNKLNNFIAFDKISIEYIALCLGCTLILLASVILPLILTGYDYFRLFGQMLIVLAPCFVIGCVTLSRYTKVNPYWIAIVVLVPYFLCTTSLLYEAFGMPRKVTFNDPAALQDPRFVYNYDSQAAKWLGVYYQSERINTDGFGNLVLQSQGIIPRRNISSNIVQYLEHIDGVEGFIFLRFYNLDTGLLTGKDYKQSELKVLVHNLSLLNNIYSNNGSEVWK